MRKLESPFEGGVSGKFSASRKYHIHLARDLSTIQKVAPLKERGRLENMPEALLNKLRVKFEFLAIRRY